MDFTIAGTKWSLYWDLENWQRLVSNNKDAHDCNGWSDPMGREVFLLPDLALPVRQEILVHELIHISFMVSGGNDMEYWKGFGDMGILEEHVAARLETPLASVLRENPVLVRMIATDNPWPEENGS